MPNINNLVKFFLYADDANILITADSEAEAYTKLNELSALLIKWVDTNGIFLNLMKTNYLLFSRSRRINYHYQEVFSVEQKSNVNLKHVSLG